ncbi:MAG: CO2 hydration protein [Pseudanabaenaceae cyanobacterium]
MVSAAPFLNTFPDGEVSIAQQRVARAIARLQTEGALLPNAPGAVTEIVGILKSYGEVLDAYQRNLLYIAHEQFLVLVPIFKYMNGDTRPAKLWQHFWHNRINFEFAEYCMRAMMWHGGGGVDRYLDSPEFVAGARRAIAAKAQTDPLLWGLAKLFPEFLVEQVRQACYYAVLGMFWSVMAPLFLDLSDRYDRGEISAVRDIVDHVLAGLVAAAAKPLVYQIRVRGQTYDLLPAKAGLTFLADAAVPYVETVFFRSFPFRGTVSYNAQAGSISRDLAEFTYGALYADPVPIGGAGIPPTLLAQDLVRQAPPYLLSQYRDCPRPEVALPGCMVLSFQKSMFCVTSAAIRGLAPHPLDSADPAHQAANQAYLQAWGDRLQGSRLPQILALMEP